MTGFSSLDDALVIRILEAFADSSPVNEHRLPRLRLVSRQWFTVVKALLESFAARSVKFSLTPDAAEVAKAYGGRAIRKLTVVPSKPPCAKPKSVSDWEAILRAFPHLIQLKFKSILATEQEGDAVLDAASRCCPKLSRLILDSHAHSSEPFSTERLRDALVRWRRTNGVGGLLHLSTGSDVQPSAILAIIEQCPHFVDYSELMHGSADYWDEFVTASRHLKFKAEDLESVIKAIGPTIWTVNLAEWLNVDKHFFGAFKGKTLPKVKWLRIGYDDNHAYESFEITAEDLSCLLESFPNLEHLEVAVEESSKCHYDAEDLFEAPFAETLAHRCPRLRRLQLTNMLHGRGDDLPFHDEDFAHFARMSRLEDIEFAPVLNCSVEAIFALAQTPPGLQKTRRLEIGRSSSNNQVPLELAADFLDLLANMDADKLENRPFYVRLNVRPPHGNWDKELAKVGAAMGRLRAAHPTKALDPERFGEWDPPVEDKVRLLAHWDEEGELAISSPGMRVRCRYMVEGYR
ncbi:hypothetical protein HDU86_007498 [Geranomyces michiganensis]|nr:hypothetical protein HDU86_007498 [Geranomyces michiganensis]